MKSLKYVLAAIISALLAVSLPAFAKTYVRGTAFRLTSYDPYTLTLSIDKCVIAKPPSFKEINANKFSYSLYCRDFDDSTGTIFRIDGGSTVTRSEMNNIKNNSRNQPGHVWEMNFKVELSNVKVVTEAFFMSSAEYDGLMLFNRPLIYDGDTYLMTLEELENEYGRKITTATRNASSVQYPIRVGDKHDVTINLSRASGASARNTSQERPSRGTPTRIKTLSDIMEGMLGRTMASIIKEIDKPTSETRNGDVIKLTWVTQNGNSPNKCSQNFFFNAQTKKAIGWSHNCREGNHGKIAASTPVPTPYQEN